MILVLGDFILDEYIYTKYTRQSPECASAPVYRETNKFYSLGGAANVANNLKHLGANYKLLTSINSQDRLVLSLFKEQNFNIDIVDTNSSTTTKTRVYNNNQYICRIDKDFDSATDKADILYRLKKYLTKGYRFVILSDYNKGFFKNIPEIIKLCNENNVFTIVDPKIDLSVYKNSYILKPNLKEFCNWLGEDSSINVITESILEKAVNQLNVQHLIVTLGSIGCVHKTKGQASRLYKTLAVESIDPTGAGDSFTAGLAYSLDSMNSLEESIELANQLAALSTTKIGTNYVTKKELSYYKQGLGL